MAESILEQVCRQERQALDMIGMAPKDRPSYLRFTAEARQSMTQSELVKLQRLQPLHNASKDNNGKQ